MDLNVSPASDRITLGLWPSIMHYMNTYESGLQVLGWYPWTEIMPFKANIYSNLAPDQAI